MTYHDLSDEQLIELHGLVHNYTGMTPTIERLNVSESVIVKTGHLSTRFDSDGEVSAFCLSHREGTCNIFAIVDRCREWGLAY